jgi:hypothetical protein
MTQMPIVLRTSGTEAYTRKKVSAALARQMEKAGHFEGYNSKYGYIEGEVKHYRFEHKGRQYKIEYFSGCFNPFLLELL